MVPLGYFLLAWLVLLAIYAFLVLLTLVQMLRHGLPSVSAYASIFIFLIVTVGVVLGTGFYLISVDWTESANVIPKGLEFIFGGGRGATPGEIQLDL